MRCQPPVEPALPLGTQGSRSVVATGGDGDDVIDMERCFLSRLGQAAVFAPLARTIDDQAPGGADPPNSVVASRPDWPERHRGRRRKRYSPVG